MSNLHHDARGFVKGIVDYLKTGGKRNAALPKVQSLLMKVSDRATRETRAKVRTVVPLTQEEKEQLEKILARHMDHPITISGEIDATLIAGLRIEIADFIIDTSYKAQLEELASVLTKGSTV